MCGETRSHLNVSIRTYQHHADAFTQDYFNFSQGIAKLDTLLTIINSCLYDTGYPYYDGHGLSKME